MARLWLAIAGVLGFLTVAGGAFGAHALKAHLTAEKLVTFETGTRYGQVHAVALLVVALLAMIQPTLQPLQQPTRALDVAGVGFSVGILLFTGSLWMLSVTGIRWFGPITPLGGLSLLVGWGALVFAAARGV